MPPILTIVCGLPGSGKSEWFTENQSKFTFSSDDFFANAICDQNPGGKSFWHGRDYAQLVVRLNNGENCCISDIMFCKSETRAFAQQWFPAAVDGLTFEWLFFENEPGACERNIQRDGETKSRDPAGRLNSLRSLKSEYIVPEGAKRLPVFRIATA
jgi:hypothetical protein